MKIQCTDQRFYVWNLTIVARYKEEQGEEEEEEEAEEQFFHVLLILAMLLQCMMIYATCAYAAATDEKHSRGWFHAAVFAWLGSDFFVMLLCALVDGSFLKIKRILKISSLVCVWMMVAMISLEQFVLRQFSVSVNLLLVPHVALATIDVLREDTSRDGFSVAKFSNILFTAWTSTIIIGSTGVALLAQGNLKRDPCHIAPTFRNEDAKECAPQMDEGTSRFVRYLCVRSLA